MADAPLSMPVQSSKAPFSLLHFAHSVLGTHTEFLLATYSDYLYFTITQIDKLGTVMLARRDLSMDGVAVYSVSTLLGPSKGELDVYAQALIELTSETSHKPLVLALGLKNEKCKETFRAIREIVKARIV